LPKINREKEKRVIINDMHVRAWNDDDDG